ncbi:MAG TPA: heme-binding protein [Steroidobacteraceae bacterium]|nr:heme-binding protein [Steroidobacteraceae bacterium]
MSSWLGRVGPAITLTFAVAIAWGQTEGERANGAAGAPGVHGTQGPAAPSSSLEAATSRRFVIPAPPLLPYGPRITLEQAKRVAAAAQAEAHRMGLAATIAVVEASGELVYFERADDASYAAVDLAIAKARSAARWRRSTKYDSDRLALGVNEVLALPGIMPALGGEPIVVHGQIIGAIGETSGKGENQVALAGARALP